MILVMFVTYGELFSVLTFLTPLAILLLLLFPPDSRELSRATVFYAVLTLTLVLLTFAAHWTGIRPFREDFKSRIPFAILDINYRWESFFGDANQAGTVLSAIVLIGVYRSGKAGWLIATVSSLFLLLTQSRTAIVALAVGLGLLIVLRARLFRENKYIGWLSVICLVALAAAVSFLNDPTLNGRIPIWREYVALWATSPILGLGTSEIQTNVPYLTGYAQDAHSVLLDSLVRFGLPIFFLGCLVFSVIAWIMLAAPRTLRGFPAALFITLAISFFSYTTFSWIYINIFIWPLLLVSLLTDRALQLTPGVQRSSPSPSLEANEDRRSD